MKITYEINLPEEQEIYQNFRNAQAMRTALYEFDRYIRGKTKHAPDTMSDETLRALQDVRNTFNELTGGLLDE